MSLRQAQSWLSELDYRGATYCGGCVTANAVRRDAGWVHRVGRSAPPRAGGWLCQTFHLRVAGRVHFDLSFAGKFLPFLPLLWTNKLVYINQRSSRTFSVLWFRWNISTKMLFYRNKFGETVTFQHGVALDNRIATVYLGPTCVFSRTCVYVLPNFNTAKQRFDRFMIDWVYSVILDKEKTLPTAICGLSWLFMCQ